MKKGFKTLILTLSALLLASSAYAAKIELYSLDGRTLSVEEEEVELYTAEGMGWFLEKPVTMYSLDGREIVVPADKVKAHQAVGWFLEEDLNKETENTPDDADKKTEETVVVKYKDGTVVTVPAGDLEAYKKLGWIKVESSGNDKIETVTMYDKNGNSKNVLLSEVEKYENEGWSKTKPEEKTVTVFSHTGEKKNVAPSEVEAAKALGWYSAYDEAVYAYAAFGDGKDQLGAVKLLENKAYEAAYKMVENALEKLSNVESEYVPMLIYLRTSITDTWREAAKSPLGFVNYWFDKKDVNVDGVNKKVTYVVFEYRNVSNSRIHQYGIRFDVCNEDGEVIENYLEPYEIENLEMAPCQKKRVQWPLASEKPASIKNLKVDSVVFSDGTKWTAAK